MVKDVRQWSRGNQRGEAPQQARIINMIRTRSVNEKKRKAWEATKVWMNTPITFPPISSEAVSEDPIIVEAEVEGYLVRRVFARESPVTVQLNPRKDMTENFKGNTFLYPLNDEIPNSKRYRHFGYPDGRHLGMSKAKEEAGNRRRAQGGRRGKKRGNKGSQCNGGNLSKSNFPRSIDCHKRRIIEGLQVPIEESVKG
ncbi:hypothetical protein Tco_0141652 [Tanacetum coccineum]